MVSLVTKFVTQLVTNLSLVLDLLSLTELLLLSGYVKTLNQVLKNSKRIEELDVERYLS